MSQLDSSPVIPPWPVTSQRGSHAQIREPSSLPPYNPPFFLESDGSVGQTL